MKQHHVSIYYKLPNGSRYHVSSLVNEVIGDNGKAIVYPASVFKQSFGFTLPVHSIITIG